MSNYSVLKAAVAAVVKTNGNAEITGENLQSTLFQIITALGSGYQFMGVATPSTSPGTPDYNVYYIGGAGTYANFGTSVTVPVGSICVFKYNGSWASEQIDIAVELKSQVDGLDAQINGGTEDEVDYTQTVTTSGSSSGYFELRDLSAFVDGNTYKITIVAGENASIRIQTRNSSNTTVQNICDEYYSVISGNTYTFEWTKQSSEVRIFSTTMAGNSYKGVFTISHPVPTQGIAEKVEYMEPIVEDNNEKINGGQKEVTGYDLYLFNEYIKTDGTRTSGGGWKRTDFLKLDDFVSCKTWQHPSVASVAYYSSQDYTAFLGYAGGGTYGTEATFIKTSLTIPTGTNYVIISTENNTPRLYTDSLITYTEDVVGIDTRITSLERTLPQRGFAHFSFDDVVYCLHDITINANTYTSLFDNDFFAALKDAHDTYGATFSLFVFLEDATTGTYATNWTFAGTTTKFKDDFKNNSSWLKFGLHSLNKNVNYSSRSQSATINDYNSFVQSVLAITGTVDCIDRLPRLGNFAGTLDNLLALRDCDAGIIGALSAYDDRVSYYLTETESELAYKNGVLIDTTNHLAFYTSLYAIEAQDPIATWATRLVPATMGRFYNLEWMGHEYAFNGANYGYEDGFYNMVTKMRYVCSLSTENGYRWGYPQDAALIAGI